MSDTIHQLPSPERYPDIHQETAVWRPTPNDIGRMAARHLREAGEYDEPTHDQLLIDDDGIVEAQRNSPESAHDIQDALMRTSGRMIHGIRTDEGFKNFARAHDLSPDDEHAHGYWGVFLGYAEQRADILDEKGVPPLMTESLRLLSAAPQYVFSELALNGHTGAGLQNTRRENKDIVRDFNRRVGEFAAAFPNARVDDVSGAIKNTIVQFLDSRRRVDQANELVNEVMRGAKKGDTGFGQILEATGIPYRKGTSWEDRIGIDWVIGRHESLGIDAKSSHSSLTKHGVPDDVMYERQDPLKGDRRQIPVLEMVVPIDNREFVNGTFYISDKLAAHKAQWVRDVLLDELPRQELTA